MDLWQTLGNLHPKLVQFPLVLLLLGLIFDAVGLVRRSRRFNWAASIISVTGTVFLLIAFICGIYAEIWAGRAGISQDAIEWHEFLANIASWGFVILMAWRVLIRRENRRMLTAYTIIGLIYYSLLVLTAYFGGQLVFTYGASVSAGGEAMVFSLHDLNTLATRQTDLNLKYSEMMHHIFGWLTLALSGSLLANAMFPKKSAKLRWVGPMLLFLGGIFLFFFADLDLYQLTDLRQFRDREVQLHKTLAIIMATVGIIGLRRRESQKNTTGLKMVPAAVSPSKVVALMALIGGGLLFTHVHTVAPYANVAAGVYVQHMIMGTVALSIGAARLLEDSWPKRQKSLAVLFATLMCTESLLLITYNEGLPWFLGYGSYNRWGPHGGTIAPLGDSRAELTYDNDSQKLNLYLLDRFKDAPAILPQQKKVNVVISRGYSNYSVPMASEPADDSHYTASVPWMKDIATFSARAIIIADDRKRFGFFDPWVTPVIAPVPPNEVARFQCVMHDGVISEKPGNCTVCGMQMVPIQRGARTTLHDEQYAMEFHAQPADGDPLNRVLTFAVSENGNRLKDFPIVHEHPMHVTITSADLSFFAHVHPILQPDGSFRLEFKFPSAGQYLVFSEFMPNGQRDQTFRFPIAIESTETASGPATIEPTHGDAKPIADEPQVTAELTCRPQKISAGVPAMLIFRLHDRDQPVTDLESYMGAMGHCAIISQDTKMFIHCHPEQLYPPDKDSRGGPVLAFHTIFPKPGLYKIWGQFQRGGKVLVADFVVEVHRPLLPASVINLILND